MPPRTAKSRTRELIANSVYRPLRGRFKIYIIDEVHMLTKDAFNTLLKVMEEPPDHVKFILATTEPHKVLPTIQSRCQRFDFRNIPTAEIARHLGESSQEELKAESDVLMEIARLASGSMRDGLSLLDRLIAAVPPGQTLDSAVLEQVLGLPERTLIADLIEAVADGDPAKALARTATLLEKVPTRIRCSTRWSTTCNLMLICVRRGQPTRRVVRRSAPRRRTRQAVRRRRLGSPDRTGRVREAQRPEQFDGQFWSMQWSFEWRCPSNSPMLAGCSPAGRPAKR